MRREKLSFTGLLTTFLCYATLLLAACNGASPPSRATEAKASQDRQILISGAEIGTSDISTFDPALVGSEYAIRAIENVFTGLVQLGDDLRVHPQLASRYDISSDHLTYTFHLKPGLKFSDGSPLTSQDVVYSINRALDPKTMSLVAPYYLKYIKDAPAFAGGSKTVMTLIGDSLLAPDPQTVVIKAASPIAFFLETLTFPTSWVVEKKVIDQWGTNWTDRLADNGGQGGAGPFKVQEYTRNKQIVFVPNTNYYDRLPQLRKVIFPFVKDAQAAYSIYQVGGLDESPISSGDIEAAKSRPDFHIAPFLTINYYTMNYLKKPFDITVCRQAFALSINKDLIVQRVWKDAVIPTNHIVPYGEYGYNAALTGPDGSTSTAGNPARAKQLLAQCEQAQGYANAASIPLITLTYPGDGEPGVSYEASVMQQMWQNVLGINVRIEGISSDKLFTDILRGPSNPLQFYKSIWIADYPDPQDWITLQFDKGSISNTMNFGQNTGPDAPVQQALQQEMEAADFMTDPIAREHTYWKIEQELIDDVAWMPMEQQEMASLRKPCVQGRIDNALGLTPPDDWASIYISTATPCAKTT